jgi:quercetin dioxygenase-like cupin family protein
MRMNNWLWPVLGLSAVLLSLSAGPQILPVSNKDRIVVRPPGEPASEAYDAGQIRILGNGGDKGQSWSLVELSEKSGYKTSIHRHRNMDETYYVLEGVLTVRVADRKYDLPAGSYVTIPRGTPHAQGNFGKAPVRVLLTITPGVSDRFFRDRIDLYKTVKPGDLSFPKKFAELRARHDVEILNEWDGS